MNDDWTERLDAAIDPTPDRPAEAYLPPARTALRRHRRAIGLSTTAMALVVSVGLTTALSGSGTDRADTATDPTPSITPDAPTDAPTSTPTAELTRTPAPEPSTTSAPSEPAAPTADPTAPTTVDPSPPVVTPDSGQPADPEQPADPAPATTPPPETLEPAAPTSAGGLPIVESDRLDDDVDISLYHGVFRVHPGTTILEVVDNPMAYVDPYGSAAISMRRTDGVVVWSFICFTEGRLTEGVGQGSARGDFAQFVRSTTAMLRAITAREPVVAVGSALRPGEDVRLEDQRRSPAEAAPYGDQDVSWAAQFRLPDDRVGFTLAFADRGDPNGRVAMTVMASDLEVATLDGYLQYLRDQQPATPEASAAPTDQATS